MNKYVVDASALAVALVDRGDDAVRLRRRLPLLHLHAPHLIDAELGNVLRRQEIAGAISPAEADAGRLAGAAVIRHRYGHDGLLGAAAWALRHNVTFYDALYVVLAAALGVPLLTADRRLSTAPGLPCSVEVV